MRRVLSILSAILLLSGMCSGQEAEELKSLCRNYSNQNRNTSKFVEINGGMLKIARAMLSKEPRKAMDLMHPKSMYHFTAEGGDSEAFRSFLSEVHKLLSSEVFVDVKSGSGEEPEEKNPLKWFIVEEGDYITDLVTVSEQEGNLVIFSINGRMSKSDAKEVWEKREKEE